MRAGEGGWDGHLLIDTTGRDSGGDLFTHSSLTGDKDVGFAGWRGKGPGQSNLGRTQTREAIHLSVHEECAGRVREIEAADRDARCKRGE